MEDEQPPQTPVDEQVIDTQVDAGSAVAAATGAEVVSAPDTQETAATSPATYVIDSTQPFEQLGFKDVSSPEDGFNRLIERQRMLDEERAELQRRLKEIEPWAEVGRQIAPQVHQQRQQHAQPQQPTTQTTRALWEIPRIDESIAKRYVRTVTDESTGEPRISFAEGTPQSIRETIEERQRALDSWQQTLLWEPDKFIEQLAPLIEKRAEEKVQAQWQQINEQQAYKTVVDTFFEQNENWLYARDPQTNGVLMDSMGQPVLSAKGQKLSHYIDQLPGLPLEKQLEIGMLYLGREEQAAQPTAQQIQQQQMQAAQQQVTSRRQQLRGATAAKRDPVSPPPATETARRTSFGESIVELIKSGN